MVYPILILVEIIILFFLSRKVSYVITNIIGKLIKSEEKVIMVYSIFFLPGTFIHEISHFITALFLFVRVGEINLTPRIVKKEDGSILVRAGSVTLAKTDPIRGSLIGLAPLLWGVGIISFLVYLADNHQLYKSWYLLTIIFYFIFQIANTMFTSRKDLKSVFELTILITVTVIILKLLGLNISWDIYRFSSLVDGQFLSKILLYLSVPVGMDLIIVSVSRLFSLLNKKR